MDYLSPGWSRTPLQLLVEQIVNTSALEQRIRLAQLDTLGLVQELQRGVYNPSFSFSYSCFLPCTCIYPHPHHIFVSNYININIRICINIQTTIPCQEWELRLRLHSELGLRLPRDNKSCYSSVHGEFYVNRCYRSFLTVAILNNALIIM